jgi:uncharacterized protein involved in exopolysaccharide biosynthesis
MNRKAIEYGVLSRDVESTRQIYESLLQRAKETGVSTEAPGQALGTVAAPAPNLPYRHTKAAWASRGFDGYKRRAWWLRTGPAKNP